MGLHSARSEIVNMMRFHLLHMLFSGDGQAMYSEREREQCSAMMLHLSSDAHKEMMRSMYATAWMMMMLRREILSAHLIYRLAMSWQCEQHSVQRIELRTDEDSKRVVELDFQCRELM